MEQQFEAAPGGEPALDSSARQGEPSGFVPFATVEHVPFLANYGQGLGAARAGAPQAPGPAGLPCPMREQVNWRLVDPKKKPRIRLVVEIDALVRRFGLGRLALLTITFPDALTDGKEAQRRYNSFASHVLRTRYVVAVTVFQRTKKGRPHFHCLLVVPEDIRDGVDLRAFGRRDYRSAGPWLRQEWVFLRSITNYDGKHSEAAYGLVGRLELMPISSAKSVGWYLGRYLGRFQNPKPGDRGIKKVRFGEVCVSVGGSFSFHDDRAERVGKRKARLAGVFGSGVLPVLRSLWQEDKKWALWLLYASKDLDFMAVIELACESLKYYRGIPFALADAVDEVRHQRVSWSVVCDDEAEVTEREEVMILPHRELSENAAPSFRSGGKRAALDAGKMAAWRKWQKLSWRIRFIGRPKPSAMTPAPPDNSEGLLAAISLADHPSPEPRENRG